MAVERIDWKEREVLKANPPEQVKAVIEAFKAHVEKVIEKDLEERGETGEEAKMTADFWRGRVYWGLDEMYLTEKGMRWVVGDGAERGMYLIYYPKLDEWRGMYPFGEEFPLDGGFDGALACCEIYFTG